MLNTLYHIEGYIIGHNHVLNYLDQYIDLKREDLKTQMELNLMTLPEYAEAQKNLAPVEKAVAELRTRFEDVRKTYVMILEDQRKKIHGNN